MSKQVSRKTAAARREKRSKYVQAGSLICFFVLWQLIAFANIQNEWFNPNFLPSPLDVIQSAVEYAQAGTLLAHIGISLYRLLVGFVIGTVISVIIGSLMCLFRTVNNILSPIVNLFGSIPVMAFLPMFLIWFGIGEGSKITLIAYTTVIAMLPYVTEGIRNTDPLLVRSSVSLGASNIQVFTHVLFRSALPNIFVGMKACLGLAFSSLVVAEMMGASTGLGFIIVDAKNWFRLDDMFMSAIIIGLLYTLFYGVLTLLERLLFPWKRSGMNAAVES